MTFSILLLPTLSITHTSSSSLLPESLSLRDSLSCHGKSAVISRILYFLLLKDTTDTRRCESHNWSKEGSRAQEGSEILNTQEQQRMELQKCVANSKSNKAFIHFSDFYLWIQIYSGWLQFVWKVFCRILSFWSHEVEKFFDAWSKELSCLHLTAPLPLSEIACFVVIN